MDWLKCNICFNTYNESSLRPRSLRCGHTYCESCLKNVIQNETLTCPQCREIHEISSVLNIPINFNLEGLLKSLSISSQGVTEQIILNHSPEKSDTDYKRESNVSLKLLSGVQEKCLSQKELLSKSAGMCNDHPSKECLFRCSVHMCWVCEKCIEGNGDHPKSKCKILPFKEEIEFRKQEHRHSLEGERKSCNQSFSVIENHISCLRDKRENHITLVHHLREVLDMHRKDEENLQSEIISFQRIISEGKSVHQELLDAEGTVINAVTLDESNAARDLIKIKTAETRKWIDNSHREVIEGKQKIDCQAYSVDYKEKYEVMHKELEKITNKSGINEQSAHTIKSRDTEFSRLEVDPTSFWNLTNMESEKRAKNEAKKDTLSEIVKAIKSFVSHDPKKNPIENTVHIFRVKIILRLLQLSFFNFTFKVPHEAEEGLSAKSFVKWIKEDLDDIWAAQHGTRQILVKHIHGIISNLTLDISPEQFEKFFGYFQTIWSSSNMKQRDNLLELVRLLLKDGKYRVMSTKVMSVLWSLAHSDDNPTKIMDEAIYAHVKILDSICSHLQKKQLLDYCVEELKHERHVLTALKYMKEVICTYSEELPTKPEKKNLRFSVISILQNQHNLVDLLADDLTAYMKHISLISKRNPNVNHKEIFTDGHYNHMEQVQERLSFLQFILQAGNLWLCEPPAEQIWSCLVENADFVEDRDTCLKWFSTMIEGDDLDPEDFNVFLNKIILLDPSTLTETGMDCFAKFFKAGNKEKIRLALDSLTYNIEDKDLMGLDYLWRIILYGSENIFGRANELIKETFTNSLLQPMLKINHVLIHDYFISKCMSYLEKIYDNVLLLEKDMNSSSQIHEETMRMCRVLTVLYDYIFNCDEQFVKSAYILSHKFQDMLKKYSATKLYYVK